MAFNILGNFGMNLFWWVRSFVILSIFLQTPLEFQAVELKKYFKMGDHAKVISGRYEGDTGLIIRVLENRVFLFSDLTMHELEVLPRDLQLCSDMATGVDSLGQFQYGDLVQLEWV